MIGVPRSTPAGQIDPNEIKQLEVIRWLLFFLKLPTLGSCLHPQATRLRHPLMDDRIWYIGDRGGHGLAP